MNIKLKLNKIEHHLLSMQVMESEPLFVLYADTKRDIKRASLDIILKSLIRLIDLGFSECIIYKEEEQKWLSYNKLTIDDLKKRFEGQSDEEKLKYPKHTAEYYFKITPKGKEEEKNIIYDSYYQK